MLWVSCKLRHKPWKDRYLSRLFVISDPTKPVSFGSGEFAVLDCLEKKIGGVR